VPISLKLEADASASELRNVLRRSLGQQVTSLVAIGGGRNSRVYRVADEASRQYAVKVYFRHVADDRDRLGVEYASLRFLWEHGYRCVPRPLAIDRDYGYAVYEYIEGTRIVAPEVMAGDIEVVVSFLNALKGLSGERECLQLPPASEAYFSGCAVAENVGQRLKRLQGAVAQHPSLREFLDRDFIPIQSEIVRWAQGGFQSHGLSWGGEIPQAGRTLSPSDFGFHNALRRVRKEIVFLDFEYFGWDDPAKMISDFLLHPAMDLSESFKRQFLAGVMAAHYPGLRKRVEFLYPLFGLKWCLILLNEFLPEHLERRGFSQGQELDRNALQHQQLAKARGMLNKIKGEYGQFPYH